MLSATTALQNIFIFQIIFVLNFLFHKNNFFIVDTYEYNNYFLVFYYNLYFYLIRVSIINTQTHAVLNIWLKLFYYFTLNFLYEAFFKQVLIIIFNSYYNFALVFDLTIL